MSRPRIYFPNFWLRLRLLPPPNRRSDPLVEAARFREDGTFLTDTLVLETRQKSLTKIDIRLFLTKVYGLDVVDVRTVNVIERRRFVILQDIKKRVERKQPDFKRIYVRLSSQVEIPFSPTGLPDLLKKREAR
uniref:Large ribosomal subunit protein uL23m n=1 Tax=Compsopogon caeruleus TaxID=31354 RepID=A0A7S1TGN4_9RHOD|mmetsp:Transcript_5029/g.10160  ORF Transcript_5029/g.10160 Transcript_5029/m.10160 type:complete len:133 (+) Transcript_5029:224-622(+)